MATDAALDNPLKRFHDRNLTSQELFEQAQKSLLGGNTRTLLYTASNSTSLQRGEGHKVYDEDGHEYRDFVGELTAGLYGHWHSRLREALSSALHNIGLSLVGTAKYEQRYASLLCPGFNLDRVRFASSGTEVNLHCLAAAQKFTRRRTVVVSRGAYHGGVLAFTTGVALNNIDQAIAW